MKLIRQLARIIKGLFRQPPPAGSIEDSPEMEMEIERKRGMRGV